jgi:hypothetical protein
VPDFVVRFDQAVVEALLVAFFVIVSERPAGFPLVPGDRHRRESAASRFKAKVTKA